MKIKFCDQTDCVLHPDHIKVDNKEEHKNSSTHAHTLVINTSILKQSIETLAFSVRGDNDINKSVMTFSINEDLLIPLECIFCKYRKTLDMKKYVWAHKAKKLLEGG